MDKKNLFFCLSFILIILVLLTHMSTVLSSSNIIDEEPNYSNSDDFVYYQNEILSCDHLAYISVYNDTDYWLYEFNLGNPGNLTGTCSDEEVTYLSSGSWTNNGTIIAFISYNDYSELIEINPLNCEINYICREISGFLGLAYDPITGMLYTSSDNNYLLKINPETCELEQIGPFGGGVLYMIGMAFDAEGTLYGWDLSDRLWTINTETGEATEIGPLGINIPYGTIGHFCFEDDILYLISYNYLIKCDKKTGECELAGYFDIEGYAQITLLVIPYDYYDTTPPVTNISLKGNMSEFGIYTGDVQGTLNATDDLSGVNITYYRISTGELNTYIEPFIVSGHGEHCLTYWSVDNAGNKEDTNFVYINIDLVPPEIRLKSIFLENNSYKFDAYTSDSGSGDYKVEYYIDQVYMCTKYRNESYNWIWDPPGPGYYMVSGLVYDRAGHTGYDEVEVFVPRYRIDTNLLYQYLLERFPLLEVFLRIIYH